MLGFGPFAIHKPEFISILRPDDFYLIRIKFTPVNFSYIIGEF